MPTALNGVYFEHNMVSAKKRKFESAHQIKGLTATDHLSLLGYFSVSTPCSWPKIAFEI